MAFTSNRSSSFIRNTSLTNNTANASANNAFSTATVSGIALNTFALGVNVTVVVEKKTAPPHEGTSTWSL